MPTLWCWVIPRRQFHCHTRQDSRGHQTQWPDIYGDPEPVTRDVYTIRADVEQGDSGGPLIDLNGQVLGVVFGAAIDDAETGFVLTAGEVAGQLAKIGATQPVGTGACVS